MPRSGLTSRLKQLRNFRESSIQNKTVTDSSRAVRNLKIPGFRQIGEYTFFRREFLPGIIPPQKISGLLLPADQDSVELLFFDLETSGLSSGAGTLAFLAGFGSYIDGGFLLEQYFLSDYPGEAEFLGHIRQRVERRPHFVSYNGKSFDASLLKTRGLMHGFTFSFTRHLDLLYISRRLWRDAVGSCSLGNIERRILGLERKGDLPGSDVPERWFSFLRTADAGLLMDIFSHHRQDILSLERLWKILEELFLAPSGHGLADQRSLGLYLLSRGDQRGAEYLSAAWQCGDFRAGRLLALYLKRNRQITRALELWRAMAHMADPAVCEELAKYYEHREKRYDEAENWARQGLAAAERSGSSQSRVRDFVHRIHRLEKKIASQY
ncbi:ribonuclease H-like domain-containing protein [Marispirochaeta sp.]|uniref:ribonuclease H-like domain-containing protein n=1 Tax=Marispirochaeta sp. TaxID=2038653 RepID=UPI0029C93795|nr:ribonuclease H-like domain-containing protein [Marispirochaeta sp.]